MGKSRDAWEWLSSRPDLILYFSEGMWMVDERVKQPFVDTVVSCGDTPLSAVQSAMIFDDTDRQQIYTNRSRTINPTSFYWGSK